jgi:hypothetical protein
MSAVSNTSQPLAQPLAPHEPLPVALSLDPPAVTAQDLPVVTIPRTLPIGEPHGPLSWLELLGER